MKKLKKIPTENISSKKLRLFKPKNILEPNSHNLPDYKNSSLIAKLYHLKGKLDQKRLQKEEKALNQAALKFFEMLYQPEHADLKQIKDLESHLQKSIQILQKIKKAKVLKSAKSPK